MRRLDFLKSLAMTFVAPKLLTAEATQEKIDIEPIVPEIPKPRFFTKEAWEYTKISQFYAGEELRIGDVVGLYHDGKVRLVLDKRNIFGKVVHVERQKHIVWIEH